jgi:hypothetical protein
MAFRFSKLYLTLLTSNTVKSVRLPITVGTGPCKFEFVRFLMVTSHTNAKINKMKATYENDN